MPGHRITAPEAERRTCEALAALQAGRNASSVTAELASIWGVSQRQASRYVAAARRRLSWGVAGDSLAPSLHQAMATLQDLAASAAAAGDLREANKAWATYAALLKSASRVDAFNVYETHRHALGATDPEPFPAAPGDDDESPPF